MYSRPKEHVPRRDYQRGDNKEVVEYPITGNNRIPVSPSRINVFDFAEGMGDMTEQLIISSVKVGKDKDGKDKELHLKTFVYVSLYGDLNKIAMIMERPRVKLPRDEDGNVKEEPEPNYPHFGADRNVMLGNGMRALFMAPKENFITSTGVSFKPDDPDVMDIFRDVYFMDRDKIRRAQHQMMTIIRSYFDVGLFTDLNRVFFASHLLQKLWAYLFNRVHQNRHQIVAFNQEWNVRPLTNIVHLEIQEVENIIRRVARQRHSTLAKNCSR